MGQVGSRAGSSYKSRAMYINTLVMNINQLIHSLCFRNSRLPGVTRSRIRKVTMTVLTIGISLTGCIPIYPHGSIQSMIPLGSGSPTNPTGFLQSFSKYIRTTEHKRGKARGPALQIGWQISRGSAETPDFPFRCLALPRGSKVARLP